MKIEVQGADRLMRKLQNLGGDVNETVKLSLMQAGKMVQGSAKQNCAVDTGQLRNSIISTMEESTEYNYQSRGKASGLTKTGRTRYVGRKKFTGKLTGGNERTVVIGTNVDHAVYVELGTGQKGNPSVSHRQDWPGMEPQPFLGPALDANRKRIVTRFIGNLKRAIRAKKKEAAQDD